MVYSATCVNVACGSKCEMETMQRVPLFLMCSGVFDKINKTKYRHATISQSQKKLTLAVNKLATIQNAI